MMGVHRWWVAMAAAGALAACAHQAKNFPDGQQDEPYRIGREDVLDIAVWRDPDLSRVLPVRPDGCITLPIAGDLVADGKTAGELAEEISLRMKPIIQDPRVTVIVREVNSSRVFVTGEVAHPGAYPLRGRVSLLQVIALAGGFSEFANTDGMMVIRPGKDGGKVSVRYSDLTADDGSRTTMLLRSGDTVVVP
jgi:polysaccharide export outer membrane protein